MAAARDGWEYSPVRLALKKLDLEHRVRGSAAEQGAAHGLRDALRGIERNSSIEPSDEYVQVLEALRGYRGSLHDDKQRICDGLISYLFARKEPVERVELSRDGRIRAGWNYDPAVVLYDYVQHHAGTLCCCVPKLKERTEAERGGVEFFLSSLIRIQSRSTDPKNSFDAVTTLVQSYTFGTSGIEDPGYGSFR